MITRIRKVYMGVPVPSWPKAAFDINIDIQKLENILAEIQLKSGLEVELVGGDVVRISSDVEKLKEKMGDADGILAFNLSSGVGALFRGIVDFGVPTILFSQPYSGHDWSAVAGMVKKGQRVDVLATSDYNEILSRIRLLDVVRRLKETKIIYIRNGGVNTDYAARVKEKYGVEIISVDHNRLVDIYNSTDLKAAEEDAERWITNALKMVEPSRDEIIKSSRMYLAIKKLLEEEKAIGITINCLGLFRQGALPAYPCLAFSRLNDEGLTGVCEADLDSTLTQLMVGYIAKKPGFVSDPVIDTATNTVIHAHCVAATRMDGPANEPAPYIVRSHLEDDKGASLQVLMRIGQKVTVAKLVGLNTMLVSTGEIIASPDVDRGCRTKITTKVPNARKMLDNWSGGLHRVIFYGDWVEDVINLGKLLSYDVVFEG
jgi:L-fucose isomerase-like protein